MRGDSTSNFGARTMEGLNAKSREFASCAPSDASYDNLTTRAHARLRCI
jgi:hypothetical protein